VDPREVEDGEHQIGQPECEPHGSDYNQSDRREDEARIQEQQAVSEQPQAIAPA
jgi:hypothetical protein